MNNEILVSIICNTYNHEPYISDAIESFLMQETNFNYEILIHDDASTDKTVEIIEKYEKQFPEIIKPIYQKKNQYSLGEQILLINSKRAIGKYFAICEGDDYWTDSNKLQKQFDFLENNPEYSLCVHASKMVDEKSNNKINDMRPSRFNKEFIIEEIIEGGGGLFATNSMFYRSDMGENRPNFFYENKSSFGDYQLMILLAIIGKIYYIDEFMSIYRYNVPGSWSTRNLADAIKLSNHIEELNNMLDEVNNYTRYEYDNIIQKTKNKNNFNLLIHQGKYKEAKSGNLKHYYKSMSAKRRVSILLKQYSPQIYEKLVNLKGRYLNAR